MDFDEQNKKRRSRSERHQHKEQERKKTRSERHHQQQENKQEDLQEGSKEDLDETIIYRPSTEDDNLSKDDVIDKKKTRRSEKNEQEREKKNFFTWKKTAVIVGSMFLLLLIGYTTLIYGGKLFVDEKKLFIAPPTTIETEEGEVIWYVYDEFREPVDLDQIPKHVQEAFISIEDKRFYSHSGVDFRSIVRALYRDIVARSKVEGASTLTQQLAKNLFLTNDKTWYRKVKEAMISLYLEREFTKDEILEMYLNVIYFGQGRYGIEAAANKYFAKSAEDLTLEEGALLAGMVKGPNGYSPIDKPEKAKERRNIVLQTMADLQYITLEEAETAKNKDLNLQVTERKVEPAYHSYVDMVIKEAEEKYGISEDELKNRQYRITTSINKDAQQIAFEEFQQDTYFPGNSMKNVEGAFVMMEEEKGEIVAAIGGRNFKRSDYNRAIEPVGQPGSIMKPIAAYAPALDLGDFTPYSILPDKLEKWGGKEVRNANNQYSGEVSFYDALTYSKNTSSVWLINEIGVKNAKKYLEKMDIHIEDKDVRIAIGGLEKGLSPLQIAQSYRTFLHQGEMIEGHTIIDIHDIYGNQMLEETYEPVKVFSDQVAWNMLEILKSVVERGTGQSGYYPHELAGKTGTVQHPKVEGQVRDAWFVGMTPQYVTTLWMGYDSISEAENYLFEGSSYPTVLTKTILTKLDERQNLTANFTKPEEVQALEQPIELPVLNNVVATHAFGGWKLLKGKLMWEKQEDDRITFRIYEKNGEDVTKIGEVNGDNEFIIDKFSLLDSNEYYIVPYNPLTGQEGERSNIVEISF